MIMSIMPNGHDMIIHEARLVTPEATTLETMNCGPRCLSLCRHNVETMHSTLGGVQKSRVTDNNFLGGCRKPIVR